MKQMPIQRLVALLISIICVSLSLSACKDQPTDQEQLSGIVVERFNDIDQLSLNGRSMSLSEAESVLYCWASGEEDVTEAQVKEAIWIVLDCNDEVRDLIFSMNKIDLKGR